MSTIGNFFGSLGYYHHIRGRYDKAEQMYLKMRKHKGNDPKCTAAYGLILMRKGQFTDAIDIFNEAREMNPNPQMKVNIRLNRAMAYYKIGQAERAVKAMEDIQNTYGASIRVYETLGYFYITQGDLDKALAYNLEAYDYEEDSYVILDNLGQTYLLRGEWDKAREFCEKAHAAKATQVDVLYHLALIEKHDGNREKALEYAKAASEAPRTALNDVTDAMLDDLMKELEA